ncbi:MAG: hypothetical protein L0332_28405 [Chloroflexi bacterium]|nr:hypothetical protein [Chloroflexota bacterium]MCI0576225.1 hypothetical protein [Chloroflexota bacterium]MCI0645481.1 hypothetical protein [Chloroflexota bacterium]MCI0730620.1 hypothetical protein [Chloroflexota bacterium]
MKRASFPIFFLVGLAAVTLACGVGSGGSQAATVTALSQSIAATETARALPTNTSEIPPTTTPTPGVAVATVAAQATEQSQAIEATEVAQATTVAGDVAATEAALAPIKAELPAYGADPNQGRLGWIHPPATIFTEGFQQYNYAGEFLSTVARDFVLAADITWNTRFGTTGCGFVIRTDGNEEAFNQYMVIATRGAQGHVGFIIMQNGEVLDDEITDFYATGIDPLFEWQNDTTNRLVVVGRGNTFSIYTNGTKLGDVTPSVAFDRGFIAFVALNESGDTTCQYNNAWLWLLN